MEETLNRADKEAVILKLLPLIKQKIYMSNNVPVGTPLTEKYKISSTFGNRFHPKDKENKFHAGIDLAGEYASMVRATAGGTVVFAGKKGGYGKCVIVEHKYGFKSIYAHLDIYYAKQGRKVSKGDVIGFLGSTGKSTGNHLHYEIEKNGVKINPERFLDAR